MKPEAWLWKKVKEAAAREHAFVLKLSERFLKGVPDAIISTPSSGVWLVEMKARAVWPKRGNSRVLAWRDMRPLQVSRLYDFAQSGGSSAILVGGMDVQTIWIIPISRSVADVKALFPILKEDMDLLTPHDCIGDGLSLSRMLACL